MGRRWTGPWEPQRLLAALDRRASDAVAVVAAAAVALTHADLDAVRARAARVDGADGATRAASGRPWRSARNGAVASGRVEADGWNHGAAVLSSLRAVGR